MELLDDVIMALRKMHQPVIGAINGAAIGGGFCLARRDATSASRRRPPTSGPRASTTASPSSELGISYLLPARSARPARSRSCCRAATSTPHEAERIGLVSRAVAADDLLEACYELAARIIRRSAGSASRPPSGMLWSSLDAGSLASHIDHEGHAQLFVRMTTQNFEEAILARREGRPPIFLD